MENLAFMIIMIFSLCLAAMAFAVRLINPSRYREASVAMEVIAYSTVIVSLAIQTIYADVASQRGLGLLFMTLTLSLLLLCRLFFRKRG